MVKEYNVTMPEDATLEEVVAFLRLMQVTIEPGSPETDNLINNHPRLVTEITGVKEILHETDVSDISDVPN
jgi:hypothetical protein